MKSGAMLSVRFDVLYNVAYSVVQRSVVHCGAAVC